MAKIDMDWELPSLSINGQTFHYPVGTSVQKRVEDIGRFEEIMESLEEHEE